MKEFIRRKNNKKNDIKKNLKSNKIVIEAKQSKAEHILIGFFVKRPQIPPEYLNSVFERPGTLYPGIACLVYSILQINRNFTR